MPALVWKLGVDRFGIPLDISFQLILRPHIIRSLGTIVQMQTLSARTSFATPWTDPLSILSSKCIGLCWIGLKYCDHGQNIFIHNSLFKSQGTDSHVIQLFSLWLPSCRPACGFSCGNGSMWRSSANAHGFWSGIPEGYQYYTWIRCMLQHHRSQSHDNGYHVHLEEQHEFRSRRAHFRIGLRALFEFHQPL